ncbi:MAG TPA: RNB domain-containing ribonuclease [Candidatus Lustribacter sp.]|nr:RNB domain-containing ribonuclease [Candidatus Lustribacter sp.]
MVSRQVRLRRDPSAEGRSPLQRRFDAIRTDLEVPGPFRADVLEETRAAIAAVRLPDRDETALPFVTIDPPGSMDLDQAMHLTRSGSGFRVRYAIADVAAFVAPGGALDREARHRGQTIYAPDDRTPLHPAELSEGAASLLPGQVRPAYVWDFTLDSAGVETLTDVYRAAVRSVERLDYEGVQAALDSGSTDERFVLLREVGLARIEQQRLRGGSSLSMPEQEVIEGEDGSFSLHYRPPVPAEDWNAQFSLMTGMAAAHHMMEAKVGILRTMAVPRPEAVALFRRQAAALGVPWEGGTTYGQFMRSLDRGNHKHLALTHQATRLFHGAGYTAVDGEVPLANSHAAVAAPYAHVTAPLRRLADRFGLVVSECVSRGAEVPDWVRAALPDLPAVMAISDKRAHAVGRACVDAVEAAVLSSRVGETFAAWVVDEAPNHEVAVQLADPAILTLASGKAGLGDEVRVELLEADPLTGVVRMNLLG